jgi:hypothetical protein
MTRLSVGIEVGRTEGRTRVAPLEPAVRIVGAASVAVAVVRETEVSGDVAVGVASPVGPARGSDSVEERVTILPGPNVAPGTSRIDAVFVIRAGPSSAPGTETAEVGKVTGPS